MTTNLTILAAMTAILATSGVLAQPQWTYFGTFGQRHLVVVDPAIADNVEHLKKVATVVCDTAGPCLVAFWSDAFAVPASMPMTAAQQQAMVAQYVRNLASGKEELLLKCPPFNSGSAKCLR
jgi:hypothetical protein